MYGEIAQAAIKLAPMFYDIYKNWNTQPGQGGTEQQSQIPLYGKEQQEAFNKLLQQGLGGLSATQGGFAPYEAQARERFQQKTIPSIQERFAGRGESGALNRALAQAGRGLEGDLATTQAQTLMQMLGLGLTPQFQTRIHQPGPGLAEQFAAQGAQIGPQIMELLKLLQKQGGGRGGTSKFDEDINRGLGESQQEFQEFLGQFTPEQYRQRMAQDILGGKLGGFNIFGGS